MDGQGTKCRRNIAENLNRLSRAHDRYRRQTDRQTTDGRAIAYSEREREFTFANKSVCASTVLSQCRSAQLRRKTHVLRLSALTAGWRNRR